MMSYKTPQQSVRQYMELTNMAWIYDMAKMGHLKEVERLASLIIGGVVDWEVVLERCLNHVMTADRCKIAKIAVTNLDDVWANSRVMDYVFNDKGFYTTQEVINVLNMMILEQE